jgi:hypothetical protein
MLCDRYMDELIDAFEAGFGAVNATHAACPFDRADGVRHTAWVDGTQYRTATFAQHLHCRESIASTVPYVALVSHFRHDHPFVRTAVSFNSASK